MRRFLFPLPLSGCTLYLVPFRVEWHFSLAAMILKAFAPFLTTPPEGGERFSFRCTFMKHREFVAAKAISKVGRILRVSRDILDLASAAASAGSLLRLPLETLV